MSDRINIAKLLEDCPKDMALDCTMYDNLYFDSLNADYYGTINCYTLINEVKTSINFTKYGTFNNHPGAKCVIFPKGKTTWEGFHRPFKDGDVVFYDDNIAIFKEWGDETLFKTYVTKYLCCDSLIDMNIPLFGKYIRKHTRFATKEERETLLKAIKDNGYVWDPNTKTLEEVRIKPGDVVKHKQSGVYCTVGEYAEGLKGHHTNIGLLIPDNKADEWEIMPDKFNADKFDVNTLKEFDKVLVRNANGYAWTANFFSHVINTNSKLPITFVCTGGCFNQCIPFKGNEYLRGKTDDCSPFFKTW